MAESFHDILRSLQDPTPSRRVEAFDRLQHSSAPGTDEVFCRQARELHPTVCIQLCSLLSLADSEAFADLLAHYANSPDSGLREHALQAVAKLEDNMRDHVFPELFGSQHRDVRAKACSIAGECAALGMRSFLVLMLEDKSEEVVLCAIGAIDELGISDAVDELVELLANPSPPVLIRTLEALVSVARPEDFPNNRLLHLLKSEAPDEVMSVACWAAGRRAFPAAGEALMRLLEGGHSGDVRAAAATALKSFTSDEIVRALVCEAAENRDPSVALACKRALGSMPEDVIINNADALLDDENFTVRMECASVLGDLAFDGAREILGAHLNGEPDPLVKATIVEAIGHGGWVDQWDLVRGCVNGDPIVAYPAIGALGDLLDHKHVENFAALLEEIEEEVLIEAVLKRLSLYGRSNRLPESVGEKIKPFLGSESVNMSMLALEVSACLENGEAILPHIVRELDKTENNVIAKSAGRAIIAAVKGNLFKLLSVCGGENLRLFKSILEHDVRLGRNDERICLKLSELSAQGFGEADACLEIIGRRSPHSLSQALLKADAGQCEKILAVWKRLPDEIRGEAVLDFPILLKSESERVRLAALNVIGGEETMQYLSMATSCAVTDKSDEVRGVARDAVKRLMDM